MTDAPSHDDLLDQPPRSVNVAALDQALEELDAGIDTADAEIVTARAALDTLTKKAADLRQTRTDYGAYRDFVVRLRGLPNEPVAKPQAERRPRGAMRTAIIDFLADGAERHTDVIRAALTDKGVIADSEAQAHSLQVTLSRMYRKNELERPRKAVYKLPSAAADGSPSQGSEGVLDI
jgi:hypothetical protein